MIYLVAWLWVAVVVAAMVLLRVLSAWWERRLRCRRVWRQAQRILIVADERRRKDLR